MAMRLRILRSPASPKPCPIHGCSQRAQVIDYHDASRSFGLLLPDFSQIDGSALTLSR
jgi:hypothetical protein